jgi:hypothetical protein
VDVYIMFAEALNTQNRIASQESGYLGLVRIGIEDDCVLFSLEPCIEVHFVFSCLRRYI